MYQSLRLVDTKACSRPSDILEFEATGDQGRRLVPTPLDVAGLRLAGFEASRV